MLKNHKKMTCEEICDFYKGIEKLDMLTKQNMLASFFSETDDMTKLFDEISLNLDNVNESSST